MALGDERRAIGRRNEAARRAAGDALERARRAGGTRMEADRRGVDLVEDINRITKPPVPRRTLRPVAPVGGIPTQRGRADYKPRSDMGQGAAGIASPVTEPSFDAREWWPGGWPSNDGLLVLPAVKRMVMQDANGAEVIFEYAEPTA